MSVFLLLALALGVPAVVGLVRSQREHIHDRRHLATLIGFGAAFVASCLMTASVAIAARLGPARFSYIGPRSETLVALSSIVQHLATLIAFCAGFFSAGLSRAFLIGFGPAMFLLYLLFAFSNFGS
jgi:hypothetical protein